MRNSKIVKGEYKTFKQQNGSAKPLITDGVFDLPISDCELREAIKQLKNRKSPAEDQVHAEVLKHAWKEARTSITMWFQKIWETGLVPSIWKKAIVLPILKTGKDPKSTTSYRPISLTSTMGKCMERIINSRLNWLLETNNILANEQAGFRIHRSTMEHIAKFSQYIKDALEVKRILTAVLIDFKSAYDSVWKENLLLKLATAGIRSNLLHWHESFISHRTCKVRYGEYHFKYHILQTGLPQGAITSCTLFNLHINDVIDDINSIPGIICLLYADDLVFWTEVEKKSRRKDRTNTKQGTGCT
jgi:hypothetical protein